MNSHPASTPPASTKRKLDRDAFFGLAALSLVLLAIPLTLGKPGMPPTLKADEPAYLAMANSLIHDRDLLCETKDLERLFLEYPYLHVENLILMSGDGWRTLYYGKPFAYSLLAAPFAAILGSNGLVLLNMLMLVGMIWMGTFYLRRHNPDSLAALFAAGFFVLSTAFVYVFWLHPEVLNMFGTMACLFFGLYPLAVPREARPAWLRRPAVAMAISAAALAFGVYNKPMLAAMGLPVVLALLFRRRFRDLAVWLVAAGLTIGGLAGLCQLLTGYPTPYLGVSRAGISVHTPYQPPIKELTPEEVAEKAAGGYGSRGWEWIFRKPQTSPSELKEDLFYFFVGRHTGLWVYQPFSLLALALFLLAGRRSIVRWSILGSAALIAAFFLLSIPFNWHGGGGFVGNRYFILAYPAFLFLVGRIRPAWLVVVFYAAGGLLVGLLVLSPFGFPADAPTLQSHTRNHPFTVLPYELALGEIPGYDGRVFHHTFFTGRRDQVRWGDGNFQVRGSDRSEIWLSIIRPLQDLEFEITSLVPGNRIRLRIEDAETTIEAGSEPQRVTLSPSRPTTQRRERSPSWEEILNVYVYRLDVEIEKGKAHGRKRFSSYHPGARITYLGDALVPRTDEPSE